MVERGEEEGKYDCVVNSIGIAVSVDLGYI